MIPGMSDGKALSEKAQHGRRALDRLRETAAQADPAKVTRMMAHVDAQAAAFPERSAGKSDDPGSSAGAPE